MLVHDGKVWSRASVFLFYCSVTKYHKLFTYSSGQVSRVRSPGSASLGVCGVTGCSLAASWAVLSSGSWTREELPSELTPVVSRIQSLASVGLKVELLAGCHLEAAFSF